MLLPEPLGPAMPRISPGATSKLTVRTACSPPNDFETRRTLSSASVMHRPRARYSIQGGWVNVPVAYRSG